MKDNFKFYYNDPEDGIDKDFLYSAEKNDGFYLVSWISPISGRIESTTYPNVWVEAALDEETWVIQE